MLLGTLACSLLGGAQTSAAPVGDAKRGAYIFAAGDCENCHTDKKGKGPFLGGGPPMVTDFGVFYAPNISSDQKAGLGGWTDEQFHRAMRDGKGAKGELLYPVFPFPSFTKMADQDIADLWAYLKTAPPSAQPSKPQQAKAPYGIRPLLTGWRVLFFHPGPLQPVAGQSVEWNRGRYLSEAVVHCQECHSPRNALGAIEDKNAYAGNPDGPDKQDAPNLTPTGIGKLTVDDLRAMLKTGEKPDGDYLGGGMAQVVEGTSKLTQADRDAIITYIRTIPARPSTPKKGKSPG